VVEIQSGEILLPGKAETAGQAFQFYPDAFDSQFESDPVDLWVRPRFMRDMNVRTASQQLNNSKAP
jgi:hypothetical protein